jgi:hypothetical protein
MAQAVIHIIRAYQVLLSPDHSWLKQLYPHGYCRFSPTCSNYSIEAFKEHGFWLGLFLSATRISRCHPWGASGKDPVPSRYLAN